MAATIAKAHPDADIALLPGGRGDFIVTADDRVLWHKREMGGEFPEEREILRRLSA